MIAINTNIARDFVTYMENQGLGEFSTNIYIGGAPQDSPDRTWWIISNGGTPITKNSTGERQKRYILQVYYRSEDQEDVANRLEAFETHLNSKQCFELDNYDIIEVEATVFPTDDDLDNTERTVGLIEVSLLIYSE